MDISKPFIVFGEVLWDVFPDRKRLGGAPGNFAYYFARAGGDPYIVSAVGDDASGREALEEISSAGLRTDYIAATRRITGQVIITIQGYKHLFRVVRGTAWEEIPYPSDSTIINNALGLYLGTLSRISPHNRTVSDRLLGTMQGRTVCVDLNLRQKYFSKKDIQFLLTHATHVKLNDAEMRIVRAMGLVEGNRMEKAAEALVEHYQLKACCITLGPRGAVGADSSGAARVKGIPAKKGGDSVGAGDAFTAIWLAHLLKGASLKTALLEANRTGSIVASHKGALVDLL